MKRWIFRALCRLKSANYRGQISRDPGPLFPGNGKAKIPGIPGNFPSRDSRPTPLVGWDSGGCGLSPNKKKELWNRSHWNFVKVEMVPIVKFKGGNSPTIFLRSWNRSQKVFLWGGIGPKKFLGVGIGPTNFFREWDLFHTIFYCGTYSTPSKLMVE